MCLCVCLCLCICTRDRWSEDHLRYFSSTSTCLSQGLLFGFLSFCIYEALWPVNFQWFVIPLPPCISMCVLGFTWIPGIQTHILTFAWQMLYILPTFTCIYLPPQQPQTTPHFCLSKYLSGNTFPNIFQYCSIFKMNNRWLCKHLSLCL